MAQGLFGSSSLSTFPELEAAELLSGQGIRLGKVSQPRRRRLWKLRHFTDTLA